MTDRELLEMAAKAAGYTTAHKWNAERMHLDPPVIALVAHEDGELVSTGWDPLANDGDALRLAVRLGIHITNSQSDAWATTLDVTAIEPLTNDPYTATCRAIVRAAANLGKRIKGDQHGTE